MAGDILVGRIDDNGEEKVFAGWAVCNQCFSSLERGQKTVTRTHSLF